MAKEQTDRLGNRQTDGHTDDGQAYRETDSHDDKLLKVVSNINTEYLVIKFTTFRKQNRGTGKHSMTY